MKSVLSLVLPLLIYSHSMAQDYVTLIDTFYVPSPEFSVTLGIDSLHFPCAITSPEDGTNFPILILVHGTAALDMNASSTKDYLDSLGAEYRKAETYMFYEMADSLSRNGISVLRYDKRSYTVNCIEQPECWFVDTVSPYDYIKDIHFAIEFAKQLPNIDTCNIFLAGHSQGGSFVTQVGFDRDDIRGVLDMAGTALPIDSVAITQREEIDNDPAGANILRQQFDSLRNGLWPMSDTLYNTHFSPSFWLDWISHSDSAIITQTTSNKATALMYGTADRFVPSNTHFQIWMDTVTRADVTFQLFDDIDHGFGLETDSTMSPVVLDFMANWIQDTSVPCLPIGIDREDQFYNFEIYPNPTKDILSIQKNIEGYENFELIDMNGRTLMKGIFEGKDRLTIDVEALESGIYFIRMASAIRKFIKL